MPVRLNESEAWRLVLENQLLLLEYTQHVLNKTSPRNELILGRIDEQMTKTRQMLERLL